MASIKNGSIDLPIRSLPKSRGIYHERDFYESDAYWALTGNEIRILNIFYLKRQLPSKKLLMLKGITKDTILNNGEIKFTYKEAEKKYGIGKGTFGNCLKKLQKVGFIEVESVAMNNIPAKYRISTNWRKYPSKKYEVVKSATLVGKNTRFKKTHPKKL